MINKITCYFIKYYFTKICFDFPFAYATSHLYFFKKSLIMKLFIMDVYFSFKNSTFEIEVPNISLLIKLFW